VLDLVIRGGRVVTPQGAGSWDVGVQGERIAALAEPGTLPTAAVRVIDATGLIVVPGGVEPHAHPRARDHVASGVAVHHARPRRGHAGMACGGPTTHIDFCYVRPSSDIMPVFEQRAARWKGQSHVDYAFHITLAGALPLRVFGQIPEAIQQ
jgi:dihydropyrimidinase